MIIIGVPAVWSIHTFEVWRTVLKRKKIPECCSPQSYLRLFIICWLGCKFGPVFIFDILVNIYTYMDRLGKIFVQKINLSFMFLKEVDFVVWCMCLCVCLRARACIHAHSNCYFALKGNFAINSASKPTPDLQHRLLHHHWRHRNVTGHQWDTSDCIFAMKFQDCICNWGQTISKWSW